MKISVDVSRLSEEIETLAGFSADAAPAVTRVVFSEHDLQARAWLKGRFLDAGLTIREDAVGNTFARWTGAQPHLAAVATGSHVDAIPHAGKYDGVVGVLGGLEAIRALQRDGFVPQRSIELILFTSEEPTRFGIGCLGSRLLAGALPASVDETLRDGCNRSLFEVRTAAGFSGKLEIVRLPRDCYAGFIELHIEQGPNLERESVPIGLVTHIAAPASFRITIEGEGGHAGARLMPGRRDALCAASKIILAVERAALASGAVDTVATVGLCEVHPGAVNSIPSRADLTVDLRDTDEARRDGVQRAIKAACDRVAAERNVEVRTKLINADPPAISDPAILGALVEACRQDAVAYRKMISRAYHDSLFMARIAPVAMIFIPCRGGVSHRPDEYADPGAIAVGVQALARGLASLANT